MKPYIRVCAEINLDAAAYNFKSMKANLSEGTKIIAVVKTDGYGHGAIPIARMAEEYDYLWGFAVATVEEALLLRRSGIQKPVLILGFVFPDACEEIVRHEIRPTVFTLLSARQFSEEAVRQGKKVHLHIKVDTGMSRIGFPDDAVSADVVKEISLLPNVELEGLFTHFAKADERDKTDAKRQLSRYLAFSDLLKERGVKIGIHHVSNSAGIFDLREANLDAVRAGISIYGLYPSEEVNKFAVPIAPVLTLKSHVVYIKEVEPGTAVSYGGTFVADHPMRIATIPVGYGDGYPRSLSNKGSVLIRGRRAPIVGRVCMDQFMVDVTGIPEAREGDLVTLIGSDGGEELSMESLGELSGRFNYELACDIGKRVPRRFWKDGRAAAQQDYYEVTGLTELKSPGGE
ncbi:MAG: alanine racemase [Lachnospiraceae bacterium]|nr:alanine racemase [Lachnospiraceae bacterium]